ncbi:GCHFR [Bugula neritina]|uniref:GTP cyclohydrolase 1 feedback regulatory protein n=1 Tax=Bugula neritina TaxID=10212 RepID=A0A7J7KRH1_BUGNE|nr:GCHFR [Bugula neritina]
MPYILITCAIRLMTGPTYVGDEYSDPDLMEKLGAKLIKQPGNNYSEWKCEEPPRVILDKLDVEGFTLVSSTGIGQTCIWTLYKS